MRRPPYASLGASLLLLALLASADVTLKPSLIFERNSVWWSAWLHKSGNLSVADFILIILTAYAAWCYVGRKSKRSRARSKYLAICGVAGIYLVLGFLYNVFVYSYWKTFLYDTKVVLYLTVPYIVLRFGLSDRHRPWFGPIPILALAAVAGVVDWLAVAANGGAEFPNYLGLPVLPSLVPMAVPVVGFFYTKNIRVRVMYILLGLAEVVIDINRLSLTLVFQALTAIILVVAIIPRHASGAPRAAYSVRLVTTIAAFLAINLLSVYFVENPSAIPLVSLKTAGADTRQIQMDNVLANFNENIPGVVGKGLGATWFERVPVPRDDIYSVGTSVGLTAEESINSPVKFIFNWEPPSTLYKWGIVGTLLLLFALVRFFDAGERRLWAARGQLSAHDLRWYGAVLLVTYLFAMQNFTYIGPLKTSLITGLFAGYVDFHASAASRRGDALAKSAVRQANPSTRRGAALL